VVLTPARELITRIANSQFGSGTSENSVSILKAHWFVLTFALYSGKAASGMCQEA